MATLTAPHIWLDERGVAWVDDTNTKVRRIALDVVAHGWSPNEIHLKKFGQRLANLPPAKG